MIKIADFRTDGKDPEYVTQTVLNAYLRMVNFALGKSVNGQRLKAPSGRLASAISFKVRRLPSGGMSVKITVDDNIAPEAKNIIDGPIDIKEDLLKGAKVGKDGHRYRVIPLRSGVGTGAGELLSDTNMMKNFLASRSGQSKMMDPITAFIANIYRSDETPYTDPRYVNAFNPEESLDFADLIPKQFMEHLTNTNVGKFQSTKFRTITDKSPSWIVPRKRFTVFNDIKTQLESKLV